MRRITALIIIVLILSISCGCGEARYHLTVNRDGSGDIDLRVALDTLTLDLLGQVNADPLAALTEALEQEGYTITKQQGENQTGIIARKHVPELTPQGLDMAMPGVTIAAAAAPGIQMSRGFYKTRYRFQVEIDPVEFARPEDLGSLESYLMGQMSYELALTLPILPDQHNADSTGDAGKTLVWQLSPGQDNKVLVEASHWNAAGLAFTVLVILLLGGGAYWYIQKNRKEQKEN